MKLINYVHRYPARLQTALWNQRRLSQFGFMLFAFSMLILSGDAFAQSNSEDWVAPAIGFIDVLKGGMVQAGAALVGVGIIIYGTVGGLSGDMNWRKIGGAVIGGIFVMAGPKMLAALLTALQ